MRFIFSTYLSGQIQMNLTGRQTTGDRPIIYRVLNDSDGLPASSLNDRLTVDARVKRKLISATSNNNNNNRHRLNTSLLIRNYILSFHVIKNIVYIYSLISRQMRRTDRTMNITCCTTKDKNTEWTEINKRQTR